MLGRCGKGSAPSTPCTHLDDGLHPAGWAGGAPAGCLHGACAQAPGDTRHGLGETELSAGAAVPRPPAQGSTGLCCGAPCALFPFLALRSLPKAGERPCSSSPRKPPRTHQAQEEAVRLWVAALPGTGVCGGSPHTAHTPPSPPTPFATPVCDARARQISQWPPCCQPGWPPSALTGRNPVPGGSDFPQPALTPLVAQGRDTGRDALGLLNLPSSVPCVPSFRPGLAACGLTLQPNPSRAHWPHCGRARQGSGLTLVGIPARGQLLLTGNKILSLPTPAEQPGCAGHGDKPRGWLRAAALPQHHPRPPRPAGRGTALPTPPAPRAAAGASGWLLHTAEKMKCWKTAGVGSRAGTEPRPLRST